LTSAVLVLVAKRGSRWSLRRHTSTVEGPVVLRVHTEVDRHERWLSCLLHSPCRINTPLQSQSHLSKLHQNYWSMVRYVVFIMRQKYWLRRSYHMGQQET